MANSRIGVEQLTLFEMLSDVADSSVTYDDAQAITKRLMKIGYAHESSAEKQFADDQTVAVYDENGDITLTIDVTDFTEDEIATLMGQTMSNGIRTPSDDDTKPYFCVSFKSKKRDGGYKYFKFLKVKFQEPDGELETKKGPKSPQTDKIIGMCIQRLYDGRRKRIADDGADTWVAATGTAWFTSADISPDVTAPTVAIDPVGDATDVAIDTTVEWTFSKVMLESTITTANFTVIDALGVTVAGTIALDATEKVVTFTPTASLDNLLVYITNVNLNVKDKANLALAAASSTIFTTVAE